MSKYLTESWPTNLEDARVLINDLRRELKNRPSVCIDWGSELRPFSENIARIIPEPRTATIRITDPFSENEYVFQTAHLIESPDFIAKYEKATTQHGNLMIVPTEVIAGFDVRESSDPDAL